MRRTFLAAMAISIFLVISVWNISAYGCVTFKKLSIANDNVLDTLVGRSGTYDPCDNWMTWTDKFHRTNTQSYYTLHFNYSGTGVYNSYYAGDYQLNTDHQFTNQVYVGPSTSHEIIITKSSIVGRNSFSNIYAKAVYDAGNPTRPEGP